MESNNQTKLSLANLGNSSPPPTLDRSLLAIKAVVKVFVIDVNEGYWLDCGAGDAQFLLSSKINDADNITPKDLGILVINSYEDPQTRDMIDAKREKLLRASKDDSNIILEINFQHAKEFARCQSR